MMTRKGSVVITNHHASLSWPSPQLEVTDVRTQYRTDYDDAFQPCVINANGAYTSGRK